MEEQIKEIVKKYLEDNLKIEIEHQHQYYQDYPDTIVRIKLEDEIISEDYV